MRGKFITLEGPEACGKSSTIVWLREILKERDILYVREPGGTAVGEAIRGILQHDSAGESPDPLAELLLFEASRAQLVSRVILPVLEAGRHVIADRFYDSTTVYQGYGRGIIKPEDAEALSLLATGGLEPDLTILLDLPYSEALKRMANREKDRFEREEHPFHLRVREGYLRLADAHPDRIVVINAVPEQCLVQALVFQQIVEIL